MKTIKLSACFSTAIVLVVTHTLTALKYVPPTREIDVIDSEDYTFGVTEDETTNITLCYYSSNTGLDGSFVVNKYREKSVKEFSLEKYNVKTDGNQISNYGGAGQCQINVKYVNSTGPTSWTLIPFDEKQDANLSEISYKINFFYRATLLKRIINVVESHSFYQYIDQTAANFVSCHLKFANTEIKLDLRSARTNVFLSPYSTTDEETAGRISSLGEGLCGFKLENAAQSDALQWSLTATDDSGQSYRGVFRSLVLAKTDNDALHTKKEVFVGSTYHFTCGDKFDQTYCILYNPAGVVVPTEDCTYTINTVGMDDIGVWKCLTGNDWTMTTLEYTVELIQKDAETVDTWVTETKDFIEIGCRLQNVATISLKYCRMMTPNHQIFTLQPSVATVRYLPMGTDLKKLTCAIRIPKPLHDFENGAWRCEMAASDLIGGFINVGATQIPYYPKQLVLTTQLDKAFTILCEVPYSSEYCHLRAPNGTTYANTNEYQTRLGRCSLSIDKTSASDNGTWICSFARDMGVPDEEIRVDVTVAEVLTYYKTADVDVGDSAELMCHTANLPIKYCRFISPAGKSYYVHNHQHSSLISYSGRGLEFGDCGIIITKAQTSDSGYWTCITQLRSNYKQPELQAQILLEVSTGFREGPNVAATIGIAVGIVLVTSVFGIMAVRKLRHRRHSELASSPTIHQIVESDGNDGNNHNNSETTLFNSGQAVYYTSLPHAADEVHVHQP